LAGLTESPTAVVFLVVGGISAFRALRSSRVILGEQAVETRSMLRTHRYPVDSIRSVVVERGRTGMNGYGREYLALTLANGEVVRFKELNAKPRADGETVVQHAARAITAVIR